MAFWEDAGCFGWGTEGVSEFWAVLTVFLLPRRLANELLRRAYLYIVRNETVDPKVRTQAMLKLNAFPRNVSSLLPIRPLLGWG